MCAEPYELDPEPVPPFPPRGLVPPEGSPMKNETGGTKPAHHDAGSPSGSATTPPVVQAGTPAMAADEQGDDDPDRDEVDDAVDADAGKLQAVLAYALCIVHLPAGGGLALPFTIPGIPFFGVTLVTRDNRFALYHAKQAAVLWLLMVLGTVLTNFTVTMLIGHILDFGAIALAIVGLVRVAKGQAIPVPLVGRWAEMLLAGIHPHESDQ